MKERQEVIDFCLEFPHSFEDYPFDDLNWTVMRRKDTKKGFACIPYEQNPLEFRHFGRHSPRQRNKNDDFGKLRALRKK